MTQDKTFRRISELKEQIKLDMMAKRDLEENYRLMLEEKDEHIKVFQMQIRLLREGKEIPPELENKVTKSKVQSKEVGKGDNSDIQTDDIKILNEKVKRLEGLLSRCKHTIKTNKEKYTQITTEKEQINKQLHEKNAELEKLKSSVAPDTMIKLQNQMKEARKVIEQLEVDREVAIAEVKKQVHEEMELKDQELREIRQQCALLQEENKTNTDKVDRLEKSSQETLEKSREIIKRLKDEKKQVVVESEERIKQAEKTIEEEKENLIQELSRAKAAAVTCLQEETHKKVEGEVQKTVEERDQFWEKQIHDMEKQHSSAIQTLKMEKVKCEPCKVRNRNNVSIHWCVICEESLCSDCTENHRSMKISRNHELIDINRMPIQTNIADQCCFKHDNLPFEYFCIDHDVLSCKECLAESHRSCQKVMSVDIACKGAKQSQSFIDATELVDHVLETTHTIGKDEQDCIENIVKEANSVKTAVRIVKEEAIRHIEALEKSLLHDLDLKKDKIIQKSKTTIKETEDIKKSTKDKQNIFDLVNKHGSEKQAFIAAHAYKQDLTDLEKRVTGITEKSNRFTISLNPQKLQESIHSIGSIELSEVPSNIKFVQKKKCQSQMPIVQAQSMPQFVYKRDLDTKNVRIYGMTINDNNEVILVDIMGLGRILVYDKNDNYKYQIGTKHPPWDIALIPGKNLGVMTSYHEDVLQFVDFDKKSISRTVSVKESGQGGVAVLNKNIYVGTKGNINILDLEGRFIRSIKTKNEIETPWFMTLDKTGNIYYTTRQLLCCIKSNSEEVYTYSPPDNDNLWKLAVDNNGYVYVAVQTSGVYRIKPDGKLMDIVIKNENHPNPVGICFNTQFTKMILSRGNTVSVFNQK